MTDTPTPSQIGASCLMAATRRAARATSRRYEASLRPTGLTPGQFSLLTALDQPEPLSISRLAEIVGLDRTTLTANLKPLTRRGLIATQSSAEDARSREIALTPQGRSLKDQAVTLWQQAQAQTRESPGPELTHLRKLLQDLPS